MEKLGTPIARSSGYADFDHGINNSRMKVHNLPPLSKTLAAGTARFSSI